MADDLADVDLHWRIDLARNGDGKPLADFLRRNEPIPPVLREFLATVVEGKTPLKRPRKLTYEWRSRRYLLEMEVVRLVNIEMGGKRNTNLRTRLTLKWCDIFGTTPNAVKDFIHHCRDGVKRRKSGLK
jgi:hypothetical protein